MFGGKKKSLIKKIWRRCAKLDETSTSSSSSVSTKCPSSRLSYPPPLFDHHHQQHHHHHHHHHHQPLSQISVNFGVTGGGGGEGGTRCSISGSTSIPEPALKAVAMSMMNQLNMEQLKHLERALNDGHTAPCVLVPREDLAVGATGLSVSPAYISLAVWRVPNLAINAVLRSVPPCIPDPIYTCINPYHNAVCCYTLTDSPPPPYRERPLPPDRLRPPDDQDSVSSTYSSPSSRYESQGTGCRTHSYGWCSICYWEKNRRVGQKLEVTNDSVSVLGSDKPLVANSAFCLNLLSRQCKNPEENKKIRDKVGLGILICREESEVWLYNQSNIDIFVSSATLPSPANHHPRIDQTIVHKIHPGHTQEIFNFNLAQHLLRSNSVKRSRRDGPIDVFCVNVSFCKGWGPNYKRQEITECPCWLQLHLVPPR